MAAPATMFVRLCLKDWPNRVAPDKAEFTRRFSASETMGNGPSRVTA
jgi:hypothetical protein